MGFHDGSGFGPVVAEVDVHRCVRHFEAVVVESLGDDLIEVVFCGGGVRAPRSEREGDGGGLESDDCAALDSLDSGVGGCCIDEDLACRCQVGRVGDVGDAARRWFVPQFSRRRRIAFQFVASGMPCLESCDNRHTQFRDQTTERGRPASGTIATRGGSVMRRLLILLTLLTAFRCCCCLMWQRCRNGGGGVRRLHH